MSATDTLSPNDNAACELPGAVTQAPPCAFIIYGGTGDLAHRKLLPALAALDREGYLPSGLVIFAYARSPRTEEQYRNEVKASLEKFAPDHAKLTEEQWQTFSDRIFYHQGEYGDPASYERLEKRIKELDAERKVGDNRLFYTATPPGVFDDIIEGLRTSGLAHPPNPDSWRRIVIEKPFGTDIESAKALNDLVHSVFQEDQIYRIDHYLGKETVQNILVFRFANSIFEPLWNYKYVDHVQITVAETVGVESRAGYFDKAGQIRDMLQSHVLQVLTLIAMESPVALDGNAIRDEKVKVLRALRSPAPEDLARGQYAAGNLKDQSEPGYLDEKDIPKDSHTETYAAVRFFVDNLRWAGVPFYARAGKRMPERLTEVVIQFRAQPEVLYARLDCNTAPPNSLVLRIQPDEGMELNLGAKPPGPRVCVAPVRLNFFYKEAFEGVTRDAYERLILDVMRGDAALFARADEVEAAWERVTPLLKYSADGSAPEPYPAGTDGPPGADRLLDSGREWRKLQQ